MTYKKPTDSEIKAKLTGTTTSLGSTSTS